jgi:hypothetical protein
MRVVRRFVSQQYKENIMARDRIEKPERPEPGTPHAPEQAGHVAALHDAWEHAHRTGDQNEGVLKEIYDRAKNEGHSAESLHEAHVAVNEGRFRDALERLR